MKLEETLLKSHLTRGIFHRLLVERASRDISQFLDCPKIGFDIKFAQAENIGDQTIQYKTSDGQHVVLKSTGDRPVGADFHPKGDRNIITFRNTREIHKIAKHEVFHGYHYRCNHSLRRVCKETSLLNAALERGVIVDKEGFLTKESRELLALGINSMVKQSLFYEVVVGAYEMGISGQDPPKDYGMNFIEIESDPDSEPSPPTVANVFGKVGCMVTDGSESSSDKDDVLQAYSVKPDDLMIKGKYINSVSAHFFYKSYMAIKIMATPYYSVDHSQEPIISVGPGKVDDLPEDLQSRAKAVSVDCKYKFVPKDVVMERVKKAVYQDCSEFMETVLGFYKDHNKRLHDARDSYQG